MVAKISPPRLFIMVKETLCDDLVLNTGVRGPQGCRRSPSHRLLPTHLDMFHADTWKNQRVWPRGPTGSRSPRVVSKATEAKGRGRRAVTLTCVLRSNRKARRLS